MFRVCGTQKSRRRRSWKARGEADERRSGEPASSLWARSTCRRSMTFAVDLDALRKQVLYLRLFERGPWPSRRP